MTDEQLRGQVRDLLRRQEKRKRREGSSSSSSLVPPAERRKVHKMSVPANPHRDNRPDKIVEIETSVNMSEGQGTVLASTV